MKYLALIALISFFAVAILGFSGLLSQGAFMHCAKALAGVGGACPETFAIGLLHVKLYQGFSQTLLTIILGVLLFFGLLFVSVVLLDRVVLSFRLSPGLSDSNYKQRISRWLTLHQTSDPLV
ncbi:MAG: hypothetical protein KW788_01755 [Candidatus Doudnabacteria bacterium]|nr:hypothetical protein [Candidatus Doudnabacteria bacterium]